MADRHPTLIDWVQRNISAEVSCTCCLKAHLLAIPLSYFDIFQVSHITRKCNLLAGEELTVGGENVLLGLGLGPDVRRQDRVGLREGVEGGADEIARGAGVADAVRVDVLEAGELENLADGWSTDEASATWSGDKAHRDGATLASDSAVDRVRSADVTAPVAAADGDDVLLRSDDCGTDGNGRLAGGLDTEADVALAVTDDDEGLEGVARAGLRRLLNGNDADDVLLELQELVDDLVLLDGKRMVEDLLNRCDLAGLHQAAEFGGGDPLLSAGSTGSAIAVLTAAEARLLLTRLLRHGGPITRAGSTPHRKKHGGEL